MFIALLKRFAPFLITLSLGLFIASFFVTVAAPRFNFKRQRVMRKCQDLESLRYENQRLRQELQNQQMRTVEVREVRETFDDLVPPAPVVTVKRVK